MMDGRTLRGWIERYGFGKADLCSLLEEKGVAPPNRVSLSELIRDARAQLPEDVIFAWLANRLVARCRAQPQRRAEVLEFIALRRDHLLADAPPPGPVPPPASQPIDSFMTSIALEYATSPERYRLRTETDIEHRFLRRLLQSLGWTDAEVHWRVQTGRGCTDCLVTLSRRPAFVVEAKRPRTRLDESVRRQGRGYAEDLGAKYFVLTNGVLVDVFVTEIPELPLFRVDCSHPPARTRGVAFLSTLMRDAFRTTWLDQLVDYHVGDLLPDPHVIWRGK